MMNKNYLLLLFTVFLSSYSFSQVGINTDTPNSKTWLHVSEQKGTQPKVFKGIITPRYTTLERDTYFSPTNVENGLLIYNTTQGCYNYWREANPAYPTKNAQWNVMCGSVFLFTDCESTVLKGTNASVGRTPVINVPFTGEVRLKYYGGDGTSYPSGTPFTIDGLTFTLQAGTLSTQGELVYLVSGNPTVSGNKTATFNFNGKSCTVYYTVRSVPCTNGVLDPTSDITDVFVLAGTAIPISAPYPFYEARLTADAITQSGQAWSKNKVDFNQDFQINIKVNLGNKRQNSSPTNGGDGIAIVFQNSPAGTSAVGNTGGGIGAAGIPNGLMLELDSFRNSGEATNVGLGNTHGEIRRTSDFFIYSTAINLGNLTNNNWHNVVITWNKTTKLLRYTVNGNLAGEATFSNISSIFGGSSEVYFGFTASTGAATNDQRIRFSDPCTDLPF